MAVCSIFSSLLLLSCVRVSFNHFLYPRSFVALVSNVLEFFQRLKVPFVTFDDEKAQLQTVGTR